MGKKRHSQDKLWITYKELVQDWGGKSVDGNKHLPIKKLPFFCCSLGFMPFKDPVCLPDGTIFDIVNILPYIKKFKKNPVTGLPLKASDLIKLNFYKNHEGEYHCPVTYKVFTENTTIIAIKETGNVYSYEAYDELNKKQKNFKDLLTNEPFDSKNIIVIQDPHKTERLIEEFHFIKNKEDIEFIRNGEELDKKEFVNLPSSYMKIIDSYDENVDSKRLEVLNMINMKTNPLEDEEKNKKVKNEYEEFEKNVKSLEKDFSDIESIQNFKKIFRVSPLCYVYLKNKKDSDNKITHDSFTEGKVSTGFTSTSFDPNCKNKMRSLTDDELRASYYNIVKSRGLKGLLRINTNMGYLNIQIHCDLVPKTSENFLELCENGYYDGIIFHRLVKNFVIQGGDPTGTGKAGSSYYGKPFEDEFNAKLTHKGRGVLSMANSGKNTNSSQFFITFRHAPHLDNTHTVFGEVVGNIKILDDLENVPTGVGEEPEKPKKEIRILNVEVFTNPFRDVICELLIKDFSEKFIKDKDKNKSVIQEKNIKNIDASSEEIGKYLNKKRTGTNYSTGANTGDPYLYDKPNKERNLGKFNFTDW